MKKHILIVGPSPEKFGGVSTCISGLLDSNLNGQYVTEYFQSGKGLSGRGETLPTIKRTIVQFFRFCWMVIRDPIDIVHIHTPSWGGFWRFGPYVMFSKLIDTRRILHIHGAEFKTFYSTSSRLEKLFIKTILDTCDALIVLSDHWKTFFRSISPRGKIEVVQNAIQMPAGVLPKRLEDSRNDRVPTVLFLGGLTARKGLNELLEAIPGLIENRRNIQFIIAGFPLPTEPDLHQRLMDFSQDPKYKDYVNLIVNASAGKKDQLFRSSDLFILQSFDEGLPFTLLEAMSYGLPVISTPVGAIPELVEEGENGIIIPPGDHEALMRSINTLIENPDLLSSISDNNIQKIRTHYSREKMIDKILEIYNKL